MWKAKIAKSRTVRSAAQPIAASVGSAPTSNVTASENSRASAAAVADLIKGLDFVFDQLDFENEPGDLLRLHLERLALEASKYDNSRIGEGSETWDCDPALGKLLHAACQCSSYIYDPVMQNDAELIPMMTRTPSATGTEKAVCIWKMESSNTLIVSIRGTASAADHMVNLNGQPMDASLFLGPDSGVTVNAHKGFLSCAQNLLPVVLKDLIRIVQSDRSISRIMFTGHSAGGAVSSLLFLHTLYHDIPQLACVSMALCTFGSPPVTSVNLTGLAREMPRFEFALAFINEHDLISRADSSYISSIIDLYRSRYGLPSMATDQPVSLPQHLEKDSQLSHTWSLPAPTFHLVGDIIVLRASLSPPDVSADDASDAPTISTTYSAMVVSAGTFAKTLFCEIGVHKRRLYLERIRALTSPEQASSILSRAETLVPRNAESLT